MDVIDTLTVNNDHYILSNDSDYPVDRYLDSSYGFELFYRQKRGAEQARWNTMLRSNGYSKPLNLIKSRIWTCETRNTTFDIWDYVARPFVVHWVLGDSWYGLGFDNKEFIMQDNDGKLWLPGVIL